nr:hypothetical protein [Tanacetum cinerariifolium]
AALPADWPPGDYDREAMQYFLERLTAGGREAAGWYGWYALRKAEGDTPRTLVGTGGFMGPPDAAGTAEIGYSIATDWRGQGLATELVGGLVQQAAATGQGLMLGQAMKRIKSEHVIGKHAAGGAESVLRRQHQFAHHLVRALVLGPVDGGILHGHRFQVGAELHAHFVLSPLAAKKVHH